METFDQITRRAEYGGVFALTGREHSRVVTGSQNPRGGQQEVKGGEGRTSQMRHASPQEVIHLYADHAGTLCVGGKTSDLGWS